MAASRPGIQRSGSSIAVQNKVIVLVTGGNKGIGYEIVKSLATNHANYQVLLGCRNTHDGEVAVSSMGAPMNVNPIQLDISDDKSVELATKAIEQHFGRLDILINNAGTAGNDIKQQSENQPSPRDVWSHVFNVNVISTGLVTETMLPLLERSKDPRIIFISSTLGSIGKALNDGESAAPQVPFYNASKAAVNMLAVHYALKYPNFKVNTCCPGLRATSLSSATPVNDETDPALGAVNAVRLATENDGKTATYTNTEGVIPW